MPKTRDIEFATKLGERLRSARHLAGLSQEAMGAALNMTFQQIQKYEKGKSRLTVEQLDKWGPAPATSRRKGYSDAADR